MTRARLALAVLACVVASMTSSPASATDFVSRSGGCDGGPSVWRLVAVRGDDGYLRLRFRIDTGVAGQEWQIFLSDNGARIASVTRISGEDGFVRLARKTLDRDGIDEVKAAGVNRPTGESCSGYLRI